MINLWPIYSHLILILHLRRPPLLFTNFRFLSLQHNQYIRVRVHLFLHSFTWMFKMGPYFSNGLSLTVLYTLKICIWTDQAQLFYRLRLKQYCIPSRIMYNFSVCLETCEFLLNILYLHIHSSIHLLIFTKFLHKNLI